MLLTKCELNFSKNAKFFILAVFLNFWALFFENSPGLEHLELHFVDFKPQNLINRSPKPHTRLYTLIGPSQGPLL